MLFAITLRSLDGSEKKVIAVQEGLSYKNVFDGLLPVLDQVATKLGEKPPYMKNYQTWGIDNTLFSIEEVSQVRTEEELIQSLFRAF